MRSYVSIKKKMYLFKKHHIQQIFDVFQYLEG